MPTALLSMLSLGVPLAAGTLLHQINAHGLSNTHMQAQDGDIVVIPAGHHYIKVSTLAKAMLTTIDSTVHLAPLTPAGAGADSQCQPQQHYAIGPGAEIVVGREPMVVTSRKGDALTVQRLAPAIVWELHQALRKRAEQRKVILKIKNFRSGRDLQAATDVKAEMLNLWDQYTVNRNTGMGADEWAHMVTSILGDKVDPEVATSFWWLAEGHVPVNFVSILLEILQRFGPKEPDGGSRAGAGWRAIEAAEREEALTERDLPALFDDVWKRPVNTGAFDLRGKHVRAVPADAISHDFLREAEDVLRREVESGYERITRRLATAFLSDCADRGIRRGKILSRERFASVIAALDERSQYVTAHAENSVVRAEGYVHVRSVVEIVGEPGAVVHGTLVLHESKGALYSVADNPRTGSSRNVMVSPGKGGGKKEQQQAPKRLYRVVTQAPDEHEHEKEHEGGGTVVVSVVDLSTRDVVWARQTHSAELLEDLLSECEKQRGAVRGLCVVCRCGGEAMRVEGGEWDVSDSSVHCGGARNDAVLCGFGASLRMRACVIGGRDAANDCRCARVMHISKCSFAVVCGVFLKLWP
jgi:hypothetical protein